MIKKFKETYEVKTGDVSVFVRINYSSGKISLVEPEDKEGTRLKKWIFADRDVEFMQGWLNILEAMKIAIQDATKRLEKYQEEQELETVKILSKVDKLIKK